MMDPITTAVVAAATAGAAAGLTDAARAAIGDAYAGLKTLIKKALGEGNPVSRSVDLLEARPEEEDRRRAVAAAVAKSGAATHADIIRAAEALLAMLGKAPWAQPSQSAIGSYIAQAEGGSTAKVIVNRRED
jgi:hypothetical protein